MDEKCASVELKDFMECLREENNKLLNQLCFAQKCMKLFEDYRKCLIGFANSCVCDHNFDHQMTFNRLENNYKLILEEDMKNSAILPEITINVEFNKQINISETNDENNKIDDQNQEKDPTTQSNEKTDHSSGNLLNKLSDCLKDSNNSEDYRLMYLKNKSEDSEHFRCNWYKCDHIFVSEAGLSQHIRCEHFRVFESSDDILFDDEPQEMIIKCEPDVKPRLLPTNRLKAKPKRVIEEYVCEWIGCQMEFRSELELKRHENSVHNKQKQTSVSKMARFSGLKPLTIHSLDVDTSVEQTDRAFKCDICGKTYTRKDSLRYHMNCEHKSGDVALRMYYCDHCEYQTKNNSHMKRHILRRHTNERPYKCDLGDCHPDIKCFATLDQLRSHQLNIHPAQVF